MGNLKAVRKFMRPQPDDRARVIAWGHKGLYNAHGPEVALAGHYKGMARMLKAVGHRVPQRIRLRAFLGIPNQLFRAII